MDADTLFRRFFLPLYPEGARSDLAAIRTVDANSAKNPAIYAHLGDAASRFAVLFPKLVGEGAAALGELDFSDASVHRLSAAITAERRDAWASEGAPGTAESTLFNVVVHGAAYVGACIVKNHGGTFAVRSPLWESLVTLVSRVGTGDLPVFHWWLKALADAPANGEPPRTTLADRYRAHVEVPRTSPEAMAPIFEGERKFPRLSKVRYDVLYKYLKAHVPELKDLGDFPSPERFEELELSWIDVLSLAQNRILLFVAFGKRGLHLFFFTAQGFDKSLFYMADSFPEPVVRARGDKLEVHLAVGEKPVVHEMPFWGI